MKKLRNLSNFLNLHHHHHHEDQTKSHVSIAIVQIFLFKQVIIIAQIVLLVKVMILAIMTELSMKDFSFEKNPDHLSKKVSLSKQN